MTADFPAKPGNWIVRPGRLDDLDQLAAIDAACFPPGIAYPLHYLRQLVGATTSITRVAVPPSAVDDSIASNPASGEISAGASAIAGFAILEVRRHAPAIVGELVTIDVLAGARRQGIGQLLHAAVERAVQHRDGHRIRLQVSVENEPAIRFYEQMGYRRRGRIPRYYMGKIDAWWMEKCWE